jgi:hypothetical protein
VTYKGSTEDDQILVVQYNVAVHMFIDILSAERMIVSTEYTHRMSKYFSAHEANQFCAYVVWFDESVYIFKTCQTIESSFPF